VVLAAALAADRARQPRRPVDLAAYNAYLASLDK
jgi:hypothetical protein